MLPIYVKLTKYQNEKLARAYKKRENVSLKVELADKQSGYKIYVNQRQYNRIMKGNPTIINFNNTHFRAMKQDCESILSSILPALTKVASKAAPVLTKTILPELATGVSSALGSIGIDQIFGNGANFNNSKTGDIIKALAVIENELTKMPKKEKDKFDKVMMTGNGQNQKGGFLGSILASIGIPLIIKALTGSGHHNSPTGGYKTHYKKIPIPSNENQPVVKQPEGTALNDWKPYNPPPFNDDHEIVKGYGLKKDQKKEKEYCSESNHPSKTYHY